MTHLARWIALLLLLGLGLVTSACGQPAQAADVPPPIAGCENAYECAGRHAIEEADPEDFDDLHHVYWLSETIVSGGEPLSRKALEKVASLGVKTILSVDGKVPDAETARALGMRYVHVPIRYSGISEDEVAKIAKTFRELEPPFYVHCFHGKHRGPAAAAIGRVVLDGASRETAIAEMRRCGTAPKYEGLYQTVATGALPSAAETEALAFGFDEGKAFGGTRLGMVRLTRSFDELKFAEKRDWAPDPEHPDIDPRNEAAKVLQVFEQMTSGEALQDHPEDYRAWMRETVEAVGALQKALDAVHADTEGADALARQRLGAIKDLCSKCHKAYRNS